MKKIFLLVFLATIVHTAFAQTTYTMGYQSASIKIVDANLFAQYQFPGQEGLCGLYDKESATFYTCNYGTYRNVDEEFISYQGKGCCDSIDFDPAKYYGTLTLKGVIDSVEWDSMIVHFITDKARLVIKTDEREIDALYKKFYKENALGKQALILRLITYDTPNENVLSYNRITEKKIKPKRTFTKVLRW